MGIENPWLRTESGHPNQNHIRARKETESTRHKHALSAASETEFDLLGACDRLANINGYKYFMVLRLPSADEDRLAAISLVANWPDDMMSEYEHLRLLKGSPLISHLNSSTEPLIFDIESLNKKRVDGKGETAIALFSKHGVSAGLCFSTRLPDETVGAVMFFGDRGHPTNSQILELHYFSPFPLRGAPPPGPF